jgi:hypothetical protein
MGRMGTAPQAGATPGGRTGPIQGFVFELDPKTGLPTEAAIQKSIRGDYANVDLSDR